MIKQRIYKERKTWRIRIKRRGCEVELLKEKEEKEKKDQERAIKG